jgi:hypothetical protein
VSSELWLLYVTDLGGQAKKKATQPKAKIQLALKPTHADETESW